MSRKLPIHSYLVINFLKPQLKKNWKIMNLNNLSEEQTYKSLTRSKIFLSFSNFEGLGLPPAEAALAGNYVIGYTGNGVMNIENPIFKKINSGEIRTFVEEILKNIRIKNNNKFFKSYLILKKNFQRNRIK